MRFVSWMKEEIIRVIPAIIYFVIVFNFIHFSEALALAPNEARHYTYLGVTIAALIIGKVLILANCFRFINAFPNKPLIYNIVWKSVVYAVFIFVIRMSESFLHHLYHTKQLNLTLPQMVIELKQPIFWCTESWIFIVFVPYVVFMEFVRVLGKDKIKKLLFG